MKKRTVGILTHWSIPNFGSFLQAYALQNVIKSMWPDYDVRQIAYMNKIHAKMYYGLELHEVYNHWFLNPGFYKDCYQRNRRKHQIIQLRKFKNYYLQDIEHTDILDAKKLMQERFDNVVLGSDILWDYSIDFYGHDRFVFGNNFNCKNIISYAASFGTVKEKTDFPDYVRKGIQRLNAVSVRDLNSKTIVECLTQKDVKVVLDPTLLWNFEDDSKVKEPSFEFKYIAVYGSYSSNEQIRSIKSHAFEKNYKIVYLDSVGDSCDWCDIFIDASKMSPFEWCGYIKASEIFVTCTFHGLMFGLIFNKPIIFNATQFMRDKASDFIEYLELDDIFLKNKSFDEQLRYNWNYNYIKDKILVKRKSSLEFLRENIR